MNNSKSKFILILGLLAAVFMAVIICSAIGSADLSAGKIFRYVFSGSGLSALEQNIFIDIRLSRILLAGIVGFSLAIAGTVFQAILRNPLADPYIIGISSGAAVGAVLVISIGGGVLAFFSVPLAAFSGAVGSLFLVYHLSRRGAILHGSTLLLTGVVVNSFLSAFIMFIISVSTSNRLHGIMSWLMGNLGFISYPRLAAVAGYVLLSSMVIYWFSRDLDLITFGDETAAQLGVEVDRVKKILFFATALMVGAVVSISGLIGFVGLIVPHMVRLVIGPKHRFLLPAAGLFGAFFLIISDTLARSILDPIEIPVGVVTAFIGAPFFVFLMRRSRSGS